MTAREDLRRAPAPISGSPWLAGAWIAVNHPHVGELMDRIEAVDAEGLPDVDLLAEAVTAFDRYRAEWKAYEERCPPPSGDDAYFLWLHEGPQPDGELVMEYGLLPDEDRQILRILGVLGRGGVQFSASDASGLDAEGSAVVRAVCTYLQSES